FDSIEIEKDGNTFNIAKENGEWVLGSEKYPVNNYALDQMISAIKELSVLGKVEKVVNDSAKERYELDEKNAIKVLAKNNGDVVRSLVIGKASSTGSQVYTLIDEQKDVCLVSGKLRDTFGKTIQELRSNSVYMVEQDSITSVSQKNVNNVILAKKEGEPPMWTLQIGNADSEKIYNWVSSLASLSVTSWLESDIDFPKSVTSEVCVTTATEDIMIYIFEKDVGGEKKYFAKCSKTPYPFELSSYAATKFMKTLEDLQK
ncbi:MAG: DUF4340 domain-containing protein, partial [Treponema sp.]|nr:DUF4340 domain-containing protein [Treponema sp.]